MQSCFEIFNRVAGGVACVAVGYALAIDPVTTTAVLAGAAAVIGALDIAFIVNKSLRRVFNHGRKSTGTISEVKIHGDSIVLRYKHDSFPKSSPLGVSMGMDELRDNGTGRLPSAGERIWIREDARGCVKTIKVGGYTILSRQPQPL